MYGYAMTSAKIQTANDASRRVGRALSASSQVTVTRPDCTPSKKRCSVPLMPRAMKKIAAAISRSGNASAIDESSPTVVPTRNAFSCSPHGRVYGKRLSTIADPLVGQQQREDPESDLQQPPHHEDHAFPLHDLRAADLEVFRRRAGELQHAAGNRRGAMRRSSHSSSR